MSAPRAVAFHVTDDEVDTGALETYGVTSASSGEILEKPNGVHVFQSPCHSHVNT